MNRLRQLFNDARSSFWFVPSLAVVVNAQMQAAESSKLRAGSLEDCRSGSLEKVGNDGTQRFDCRLFLRHPFVVDKPNQVQLQMGRSAMEKPPRKPAQRSASFTVKRGLAEMLKGGVIMDVTA